MHHLLHLEELNFVIEVVSPWQLNIYIHSINYAKTVETIELDFLKMKVLLPCYTLVNSKNKCTLIVVLNKKPSHGFSKTFILNRIS